MDEEPRDIAEKVVKPDPHARSVALANEALNVASLFFKAKGTSKNQRYGHLESVANLEHVITISDAEMIDSLQRMGKDPKHARTIPAIYMGQRGDVLVDAVVTREGSDVNPVIMLHEFIHRAAEQGGLHGKTVPFHEQMYQLLDFSKETSDEIKVRSPEEYEQRLGETKEVIRVFNEGITQWATLHLANRTAQFNPPVIDETFSDEVEAITEWFRNVFTRKGMSNDQIEELMLDLALIGNFSRVQAALPLGDDLRTHGIKDNLYVSNLLRGIYSAFMGKRLSHIWGIKILQNKF